MVRTRGSPFGRSFNSACVNFGVRKFYMAAAAIFRKFVFAKWNSSPSHGRALLWFKPASFTAGKGLVLIGMSRCESL